VIVAHNASFDYGFISHNAQEHLNISLKNDKLCTRKLANRLLPDLPSKKLSCLCEEFGIQNEQAHRAMGDVNATAAVFEAFLKILEAQEIKTEERIFDFEKSPRGKNF